MVIEVCLERSIHRFTAIFYSLQNPRNDRSCSIVCSDLRADKLACIQIKTNKLTCNRWNRKNLIQHTKSTINNNNSISAQFNKRYSLSGTPVKQNIKQIMMGVNASFTKHINFKSLSISICTCSHKRNRYNKKSGSMNAFCETAICKNLCCTYEKC